MTDEDGIKLAIEEAKKSEQSNGAPIGAVLVKNDEVIAVGWSLVWPKKDPSAHAETECMRSATKKLQSLDLGGCVLYSTLESCSMCLACAGWTGLSKMVFGAYKEDVPENPYELVEYHAEEHAKNIRAVGGKHIKVVGGVLRKECARLMDHMRNWTSIK